MPQQRSLACTDREGKSAQMDAFRFCPDLFELRNDVLATLDEAGFQWLSHFSSVDPMHDLYGIEVCGIIREEDSNAILGVLRGMFPSWYFGCCFKDYGREPGFKARVFRDKPRERDNWETV
jgi:hypothetical protein